MAVAASRLIAIQTSLFFSFAITLEEEVVS
jgi:hypothetical protein